MKPTTYLVDSSIRLMIPQISCAYLAPLLVLILELLVEWIYQKAVALFRLCNIAQPQKHML